MIYKTVNLFGEERIVNISANKKPKKLNLFSDHDSFVEKFEVKRTTDDCYTPKEVYMAVLEWVNAKYGISQLEIIRPFYPNSDYTLVDYPNDCIIIDNPPFSMISEIIRYYLKNDIKFFLFAPHLTLFGSNQDYTAVVVGADIIYENGAIVKTSFVTNIFEDIRVYTACDLYQMLNKISKKNAVNLPKYTYPNHVLTVSSVQKMIEKGIHFEVEKKDSVFCRGLESQKRFGKAIFGSGFLLSDKAAADKAAADKAAADKAAADKAEIIVWELSEKERNTIKSLGEFY